MAEVTNKFLEDFKYKRLGRLELGLNEIPEALRPYVTSVYFEKTDGDEKFKIIAKIGSFEYVREYDWDYGDWENGHNNYVDYHKISRGKDVITTDKSLFNEDFVNVLIVYSAVLDKLKKMPKSEVRSSKAYALKQKIEENIIAYREGKITNVSEGIPSRPELVVEAKAEAYVELFKQSGFDCTMEMRRLMHKDPVFFMDNASAMYQEMIERKNAKSEMAKLNKKHKQEYKETRRKMKLAHKVEMQKMRAERKKERQKEARELKGVNLER